MGRKKMTKAQKAEAAIGREVDKIRARDANEAIYREFERSPMLWARYHFPKHFRVQSPPFHLQILNEAMNNDFLAVAAPRESAKSTLLLFTYQFHRITFKMKRFIVIVSNTFKKAAMSLDTMKSEIRENPKMAPYRLEITKDAEGDSIIKHPDKFETRILCKGAEQVGSIRGVKHGAYRPDLIIIDDIEDDDMVRNPERRLELQRQYDEALVPAGERGNCQYIAIGTILHDDSLLAKLVGRDYYTEYRKLFFRALNQRVSDKKLVSLWNEKWTVDDLLQMSRLKPNVFAKEMQNDPVAGSRARFHEEDWRYWRMENNNYLLMNRDGTVISKGRMSDCKAAIAVDMAWEEKKEMDQTVIMPGFLTPTNDLLIEEYIAKRGMRPDEFMAHLFQMEAKLKAMTNGLVPIGFERAMLEKVNQWLLKKEMHRKNRYLTTKRLEWGGDKTARIEMALQPRYSQHAVYHKHGMGDLEYQLLRFPSGSHDDLADAAQGLTQLLEYPKKVKKVAVEDDQFEWWRKQAIRYHRPPKKKYVFGHKKNIRPGIPSTITFR